MGEVLNFPKPPKNTTIRGLGREAYREALKSLPRTPDAIMVIAICKDATSIKLATDLYAENSMDPYDAILRAGAAFDRLKMACGE